MTARILVTGSRDFTDRKIIHQALLEAWLELRDKEPVILVHGGARGADTIADSVWTNQGFQTEVFPADWDTWGKLAGPLRNQAMVDSGIDLALAFYKRGEPNKGTKGCVKMIKMKELALQEFWEES